MKEQILLIDLLKQKYPTSSLNTLKDWIKQKRILINNEIALKASQKLCSSTSISLRSKPTFLFKDLKIVYQDQDIVVIDKPSELLSVATEKEKEHTVHNFLKKHFFYKKVYPVHRLDKDTSGLIVFALNQKAKNGLKKQFLNKSLSRHYAAIVHGSLSPEKGKWESYLYEDGNLVMRETSKDKGKLSITLYNTVYSNKDLSLLDIKLQTGRKNQIRVQSAACHHPIVGDKKYGLQGDPIKRLGLHAYLLKFNHPTTNKKLCFKSPIPRVLQNILHRKVVINEKTTSLQMG